jgi:hypothetical protein
MTRRTALALLWLAAAVMFAVAVLLTPHAKADATDDAFIATLDDHGIRYPSREYAIRGAKAICAALDSGTTAVAVAAEVDRVSGLTTEHAGFLTGAAIAAFCPWHLDQLAGQGMRV